MESESGLPPIRRCRAKLADLAEALDVLNDEMAAYLDLETGDVVYVLDDAQRALERAYDNLPDDVNELSDEEERAALVAILEEHPPFNTEPEEVLQADAVERGMETRFVGLPEHDTRESYRDMEAFIETVTTPRFQQRLDRAIRGRGAFRRFKDELFDDLNERERWFAFKLERQNDRIRAWLKHERIELIDEAG